jgi:hypothetical protein
MYDEKEDEACREAGGLFLLEAKHQRQSFSFVRSFHRGLP